MYAARGWKIAGAVVVMAAVIVGVGEALRAGGDDGMLAPDHRAPAHDGGILAVVHADRADANAQDASLAQMMPPASGVQLRSITTYYDRRAYPGAPPAE